MKVASIDIGSNTVLLLIAEVELSNKSIISLFNECRMPRISRGLNKSNIINDSSIEALFKVLNEYKDVIQKHQCAKVILNATQTLRVAKNAEMIISSIKEKFNFYVDIITGNREAYLSFIGAQSGLGFEQKSAVIDIGGASTEIVIGSGSEIYFQKSFPIGVVTMTEKFLKPLSNVAIRNFTTYISEVLKELKEIVMHNTNVIAVSGTPTTLASANQKLKEYSDDKVEGYVLYQNDLKNFISEFSSISNDDIRETHGQIMEGREDIILAGTLFSKQFWSYLEKINYTQAPAV